MVDNKTHKIIGNKIVINGEGTVMGRLASYAAKRALEGDEIHILNSERVIISGNRADILKKFRTKRAMGGTAQKGPNYPKASYMILKRAIRGMLPNYREGIGAQAFAKIRCYQGVPEEFKNEKVIKLDTTPKNKFVYLKDISDIL